MTTIEQSSYRECRIEIAYDPDGSMDNPREWCNLSRFVFAPHRRYDMPNEVDFNFDAYDDDEASSVAGETFADWTVRKLREDHGALYVVPVYMIDHSGVAFRVGESNPFHCPWDSGQVGYAIVTPEGVADCGTDPKDFAEAVAGEVATYSAWANGEVYDWIAFDPDGEVIESCGGYVGDDEFEYMRTEARNAIDSWHNARDRVAEDQAADAMAELLAVVG